jgi:hypothetical protein
MPKSTASEMRDLRDAVVFRDQTCRWPSCSYRTEPLEMAHLQHRGMGGSKERNTLDNTILLCRIHHNCLDGRTGLGTLRYELNEMLRAVSLHEGTR